MVQQIDIRVRQELNEEADIARRPRLAPRRRSAGLLSASLGGREELKVAARAGALDLSGFEGRYVSEPRLYLPQTERQDATVRLRPEALSE